MQIVIEITKDMLNWVNSPNKFNSDYGVYDFIELIRNGTPLPKHHGRLIDVSKFVEKVVHYSHQSTKTIGQALDETPTIIPATKEGDGE